LCYFIKKDVNIPVPINNVTYTLLFRLFDNIISLILYNNTVNNVDNNNKRYIIILYHVHLTIKQITILLL
jgi:hypothetical protein